MKPRRKHAILIALALFLFACSLFAPNAPEESAPAAQASAMPTNVELEATAEIAPAQTETSALSPTVTPALPTPTPTSAPPSPITIESASQLDVRGTLGRGRLEQNILWAPGGDALWLESPRGFYRFDATTYEELDFVPVDPGYWDAAFHLQGAPPVAAVTRISGPGGPVQLLSLEDGSVLQEYTAEDYRVLALAFSADGSLLATIQESDVGPDEEEEKRLVVWDRESGNVVQMRPVSNRVGKIRFAPEGYRLLIGQLEGHLELWDARSGNTLYTVNAEAKLDDLAFAADGSLFSATTEKVADREATGLHVWDTESGERVHHFPGWWSDVDFSADGSLLAATGGGPDMPHLVLWRLADGSEVGRIDRVPDAWFTRAPGFSPDGGQLGLFVDGKIVFWRVPQLEEMGRIGNLAGEATSLDFSPDGNQMASVAQSEARVRLWDVENEKLLRYLEGHRGEVKDVAFSPDGSLLASAGEDGVRLWRVPEGEPLRHLDTRGVPAGGVAFSPDGSLLAGAAGTIWLWRPDTGEVVSQVQGLGETDNVTFSPDGQLLAATGRSLATGDLAAAVWESQEGDPASWPLLVMTPRFSRLLKFSPDSRLLAVRIREGQTGGGINVIDARTGARQFLLGDYRTQTVAFAPDGSMAVTAGELSTLSFWDMGTGQLLEQVRGASGVDDMAFSPSGALLAQTASNERILLWGAP